MGNHHLATADAERNPKVRVPTTHGTRETGLIAALFDAQEGICFHCGKRMLRGAEQRKDPARGWSREHIYARDGSGRRTGPALWVLAHPVCNGARGNAPLSTEGMARAAWIQGRLASVYLQNALDGALATGVRTKPKPGRNPYRWVEPRNAPNLRVLAKLADFWPER